MTRPRRNIPICLALLPMLAACENNAPPATNEAATDTSASGEAIREVEARPAPRPAADARRSEFTSLERANCRLIEQNIEEGGYSRHVCPGAGGYALELTESDLRQGMIVNRPGGGDDRLELNAMGGGGFSNLGKTAEWRGPDADPFHPRTLTFRFEVVEDPAPPQRPTSYLVVARLSEQPACMVAIVPPGPDQSARARAIADAPSLPECRTTR